jgi:hypothetical protein
MVLVNTPQSFPLAIAFTEITGRIGEVGADRVALVERVQVRVASGNLLAELVPLEQRLGDSAISSAISALRSAHPLGLVLPSTDSRLARPRRSVA